jgi:hypothetical protein
MIERYCRSVIVTFYLAVHIDEGLLNLLGHGLRLAPDAKSWKYVYL